MGSLRGREHWKIKITRTDTGTHKQAVTHTHTHVCKHTHASPNSHSLSVSLAHAHERYTSTGLINFLTCTKHPQDLQALELDLDLVNVSTTSVCCPCLIRAHENNWPWAQLNGAVFSPLPILNTSFRTQSPPGHQPPSMVVYTETWLNSSSQISCSPASPISGSQARASISALPDVFVPLFMFWSQRFSSPSRARGVCFFALNYSVCQPHQPRAILVLKAAICQT